MRSMIMEDQQKKLCWEYDARRGLNRYPFAREDFGLSRFKGAHDSVLDWDAHEKGAFSRVASGRSRRSWHVRYASNSDPIGASQRSVAMCQTAHFLMAAANGAPAVCPFSAAASALSAS